jgi:hypothetical protein
VVVIVFDTEFTFVVIVFHTKHTILWRYSMVLFSSFGKNIHILHCLCFHVVASFWCCHYIVEYSMFKFMVNFSKK